MKRYLSLFLAMFAFVSLYAQHSATITVTDAATSQPLSGAVVRLNATNVTTDANGVAVFAGLADGTYTYRVTKTCYVDIPSGTVSIVIAGADAIATAALKNIDTTVTLAGNVLTAKSGTGLTYQWIDCNNGNTPVAGATARTYTAPVTGGSFAVIITNSSCSTAATSVCTVVPPTFSATITITNSALQPVSGASVKLNNVTVTTGANGQAAFSGLASGTYTYTVTNSCYISGSGSVTVVSANVTGSTSLANAVIDKTVTRKGNVLTATAGGTGITYQWLDCNNANAPIDFETGKSFIAPASGGSFAVRISNGACANVVPVTSDCTVVPVTYSATITVLFNQSIPLANAQVTLNATSIKTDGSGQAFFSGLDNGITYDYTVTPATPTCFANGSGSVTIAGADVTDTKALGNKTINDVNVVLTAGVGTNPTGYTIELTGPSFDQTISSGNLLGDTFSAVPYGTYVYTISRPCYQTITGTIIVNCNQGNPNSINATPVQIDNTITQQQNVLKANAFGTGITYQWVDCLNAKAPIEGATAQTYTATANGSYAVIVTNDCSNTATSACVVVSSLALNDNKMDIFSVYPNPVSNELTIALDNDSEKVAVEVVNMVGQVVLRSNFSQIKTMKLDVSGLSSGLYILRVNADNVFSSKRIIKQ